jgi:hypothetical protein
MARFMLGRKAQEWRQRLVRSEKSEHSIKEFCRQEGVSPQSFYLWRRRLATQALVSKKPLARPRDGFRPVRLLPAANVSVQLPGGTQLAVPLSDPQALRLVIDTLARVDADRAGGAAGC